MSDARIREVEEARGQSIPLAEREAILEAQQSLATIDAEPTQTLIPPPTPQQSIPLFIDERQVDSFERGGREIPIFETVVVDLQGNVVRKASEEEARTFQARPSVLEEERTERISATTPTGLLLERTASFVRRKKREISQRGEGIGREIGGVGLGVAGVVVGTAIAIPQIISSPIQTIKSVPTQIAVGKGFVTSGQLSQQVVQNPGLVMGVIAGEVLVARGLGRIAQVPTQAIARRIITPRAESVVSISLERQAGLRGQAIIGFETPSGRIGDIRQISKIDDITKTIGVGQVQVKAGGTKTQAFIGQIESKSVRTPINLVLEDIGGVKVTRALKGEAIAGKGFIDISPREKFFIPRLEVTPRLKSRLFLERIKGVQTLDFDVKAFAIPTGKGGRLKFIAGGTKAIGMEPVGLSGFAFDISDIKFKGDISDLKFKGDKIVLGGKTKKRFDILSSKEQIILQKQLSKLDTKTFTNLLSIASQSTATIKTPKVKAFPSIKGTIQTPTFETKRVGITKQVQTISPIQKVKQDIKIKTAFATIQTPKLTQKITQATKQGVVTRQIQQFKQPQQIKQIAKTLPALSQRGRLKLRTPLITKLITTRLSVLTIPLTTPTPFLIPFKLKSIKTTKGIGGIFGVSIRRFGKFRTIGKGLSLKQAISLGKGRVGTTLGATFKITTKGTGISQSIPTPKGFKRKKGLIFIEAPRLRLSTGGEIREIQTARRIKV